MSATSVPALALADELAALSPARHAVAKLLTNRVTSGATDLRCSVLTECHHGVLGITNMLQQKHGIQRPICCFSISLVSGAMLSRASKRRYGMSGNSYCL